MNVERVVGMLALLPAISCVTQQPLGGKSSLELIAVTGPGSFVVTNGRLGPLPDGARANLLERWPDGTEIEAVVWRRGSDYEVYVRHGESIERLSSEDWAWIEEKLGAVDSVFSAQAATGEDTRIKAARESLHATQLNLDSVRKYSRDILFPSVLLPDLMAAAERQHLSAFDEVALINLCFEDFNLLPTPEREALFRSIANRSSLSVAARCRLVRHLNDFPQDQRTALARRLVTEPTLESSVAALLIQDIEAIPYDERGALVQDLIGSASANRDLAHAVLHAIDRDPFLLDDALALFQKLVKAPWTEDDASEVVSSLVKHVPDGSRARPLIALMERPDIGRSMMAEAVRGLNDLHEPELLAWLAKCMDSQPEEQVAFVRHVIQGYPNFDDRGKLLKALLENPACSELARNAIRENRDYLYVTQRAEIEALLTN